MAYQQIQTASEMPLDGFLLERLLRHKINALAKGVLMPDNFIAEVESFAKRNSLSELVPHKDSPKEACPRCLKAFMLSEAAAQGLAKPAMKMIDRIVPGEVGHHGYYLDNEEVKPVQIET